MKTSISGTLWNSNWKADAPIFRYRKMSAVQKAGITYERKIGRHLPLLYPELDIRIGPWLEYCDDSGWHIAQPDIILLPKEGPACVLECKLKYKPEAEFKLQKLYVPILENLLDRKVAPIQVCKYLGLYVDATHELDSILKATRDDPKQYRVVNYL